jgi:hypothetical protein
MVAAGNKIVGAAKRGEGSKVGLSDESDEGQIAILLVLSFALVGAGKGAESTWRASLESPMTGERHGFASFKDFFLENQVNNVADRGSETGEFKEMDDK